MRKIITFILLFSMFGMTPMAFAHPPQDIIITYDAATKVLKAVIVHNTSNAAAHFIKKVDIGLNGQEIIEHKISKQDNPVDQTVSYLIPDARPGDTLSVEAYCSISGKLKKQITVKPE